MQFKVPQFLEIEDKIFGPFTFREFVYLAGGAGLCFVFLKLFGLILGFIPMALVASLALALTFYKPNNKPFIDMIESFVKYTTQSKLYIWKRREGNISAKEVAEKTKLKMEQMTGSKLSGSKLRDLAWSLDVLDARRQSKNIEQKEENNIQ